MFRLEMRIPTRDVLSLLAGRLTEDQAEAKQAEWLARGRKPYEDMSKGGSREEPDLLAEQLFPKIDPTPQVVRMAAYRVEMRRSLLRSVNELASQFLWAGAVVAIATALRVDQWTAALILRADLLFGVAVTLACVALTVWLRVRGARQASKAVPFRQGIEPLAWALYYPTQIAQQIRAMSEELLTAGDATIGSQWEALEAEIKRGPDGSALPGQDDKIWALATWISVQVPQLVWAFDASRVVANSLCDRAPAAAQLIEGELLRQIAGEQRKQRKNWATSKARRSIAEHFAARAYNYLMSESASFATLPRPQTKLPDMNVALAQDQSVQTLVAKSKALEAAAQEAAQGYWPAEPSTEWERPTSRTAKWIGAALAGTGALLTFRPTTQATGLALIAMGSALISGPVGNFLKEATALRTSPPTALDPPPVA